MKDKSDSILKYENKFISMKDFHNSYQLVRLINPDYVFYYLSDVNNDSVVDNSADL
jgi:hypothetical protein